jgi:ankyrin repeat protein
MSRLWLLLALLGSEDATRREADLVKAVQGKHVEAAQRLLDQGAPANARAENGVTALAQAVLMESVPLVKLLLEHGADPNSVVTGSTVYESEAPLHLAARVGGAEMMALLLDRGADINARGRNEATPLLVAARSRKSFKTLQLLLERGADSILTDTQGATPLTMAALAEDPRYIEALLARHPNPELLAEPLVQAAHAGLRKNVERIVDAGADVNRPEKKLFDTALHRAAQNDHPDVVKLLLDRGATVDSSNARGETPLMLAAGNNRTAVVRLLLERGADVSARDEQQRTAAQHAQSHGARDALRLLTAKGGGLKEGDAVPPHDPGSSILLHHAEPELGRTCDWGADVECGGDPRRSVPMNVPAPVALLQAWQPEAAL